MSNSKYLQLILCYNPENLYEGVEMTTTRVICECESCIPCGKSVELTLEEAQAIYQRGLVVIVDGCCNGANVTDQLVEARDGYQLYRDPK